MDKKNPQHQSLPPERGINACKQAFHLLFLNCFKLCFSAWSASKFNSTSLNLLNKDDRGNHPSLFQCLRREVQRRRLSLFFHIFLGQCNDSSSCMIAGQSVQLKQILLFEKPRIKMQKITVQNRLRKQNGNELTRLSQRKRCGNTKQCLNFHLTRFPSKPSCGNATGS